MVTAMPKPPISTAAGEFGRRLRQTREAKGLTQEGLAHRAGSTFSSISGYERGQTTPSFPVILDIAYALGVDPGELIRGLKPDVPPSERLGR